MAARSACDAHVPPAAAARHDPFSLVGDPLIEAVAAAVRIHMSRYDGSHDFAHIRRVVGLARHLTQAWTAAAAAAAAAGDVPAVDERVVVLAALLHDVGDRKYLGVGGAADADADSDGAASAASAARRLLEATPYADDAGARATAAVLLRCGAPADLARRVVGVCQNVSWSGETRTAASRAAVAAAARAEPALAIVQDADRLDSLGAVGVARCFAFGAAQGGAGRSLDTSLDHFDEKLVRVAERMKTAEGRRLAAERTQRLRTFQAWFRDEAAFAVPE